MLATWDTILADSLPTILNITYLIIGLQMLHTAIRSFTDKTNSTRIGTGLFWLILAILFAVGQYLPSLVSGILVIILAILTLFKQVQIGNVQTATEEQSMARSDKIGNWIFLPVALLGVTSIIVANIFPSLSSSVIAFGSLVATIAVFLVTKNTVSELLDENNRMIQQVSTTGILPQLLAALGTVFTAAGVGDLIAQLIAGFIPADNRFWGVIAYVLGMVIFTMIMGNAFAAFAVITVGIGIPFVIAQGANPAIASALAMTAGFCGTLMTPMAGNFNALPAALLEMKSEYSVIKQQMPIALIMVAVHVALMYFFAF